MQFKNRTIFEENKRKRGDTNVSTMSYFRETKNDWDHQNASLILHRLKRNEGSCMKTNSSSSIFREFNRFSRMEQIELLNIWERELQEENLLLPLNRTDSISIEIVKKIFRFSNLLVLSIHRLIEVFLVCQREIVHIRQEVIWSDRRHLYNPSNCRRDKFH